MFTIKNIALFCISALVVMALVLFIRYPHLEKRYIRTILEKNGIQVSSIADIEHADGKTIISRIDLDPNQFSYITGLEYELSRLKALRSTPPKRLKINDVTLTGEINHNWQLDMTGWKPRVSKILPFEELFLEHGQIDIATRWGGIRLETKGKFHKSQDNQTNFVGILWAVQNQLRMQSKIQAVQSNKGLWSAEIDISEAAIVLPEIETARVSGWLSYAETKAAIPRASAQIYAGKLNLGYMELSNVSITLDSNADHIQFLIEGKVSGPDEIHFNVDISNAQAGFMIEATINGNEPAKLLAFLENVHKTFNLKSFKSDILTPLMITQGNLDRIYNELEDQSYDEAKIVLSGSLYDMTGKIVTTTHKNDVPRTSVISLDPSSL